MQRTDSEQIVFIYNAESHETVQSNAQVGFQENKSVPISDLFDIGNDEVIKCGMNMGIDFYIHCIDGKCELAFFFCEVKESWRLLSYH